ncbi:MAG: ABC transporter substrate-binding protein, partial [Ktedonobacteraceae bacterium]|nr:ABC transporter substrate-binding protein [Ktedonobacteraceae bacterium]
LIFNRLQNTVNPWLAASYHWEQPTRLVFQLRHDVHWTDGQPFTSDDVAYTLTLLKQYPALDSNALWHTIKDVANPDPYTVVINLRQPSNPLLWYLAGQTYIVPRHIWQQVKDPVNDQNSHPIGTGPFKLKSFDPALYILARNPGYWQPGKPYVDQLRYPAYESNNSADLILTQGSIDWTGLFSEKVDENFVKRDPIHDHYWFPPVSVVMFYLNTAKYPFNNLAVRQAISLAIDRQRLSKEGEKGLEQPAHPSGLVLPSEKPFLDPHYADLSFSVDVNRARTLLGNAGFTLNSQGIYADQQGRPLSFSIMVVDGWTDWEADSHFIADDLSKIGMQVDVDTVDYNDYIPSLQKGNFDSAISWTNSGPSPYFALNGLLATANSAPLGDIAATNWGRWQDDNTDKLLKQYAQADTSNTQLQLQALAGLQKIMVEQVPAVPLLYAANWYEYTTTRFTGWPTQDNPYALPAPYSYPDSEVVALNIHRV